jgi:restriction system protein
MTIDQQLDRLISSLPHISNTKKYWLIRTQSGHLYDDFRENNFVAIEPSKITRVKLKEIEKSAGGDQLQIAVLIKNLVQENLEAEETAPETQARNATLKANQIYRFLYEIKKGDVVIIPSSNSETISIGEVQEDRLSSFSEEEANKISCTYDLKRKIMWRTHIPRIRLDPNFFRLFLTHQAVSDVGKYAEVIERSLNDLYIMEETSHLIIEVQTESEISAKDLFGLGYDLLQLIDDYAVYAGVNISSRDLIVEVNLNSPGKIDLKSKIKKTTVVMGIILMLAGGGYEDQSGRKLKTDGVPGLMASISKFLQEMDDREMKKALFHTYKDSLNIKNPEDLNKALKQFSENMDLPK